MLKLKTIAGLMKTEYSDLAYFIPKSKAFISITLEVGYGQENLDGPLIICTP